MKEEYKIHSKLNIKEKKMKNKRGVVETLTAFGMFLAAISTMGGVGFVASTIESRIIRQHETNRLNKIQNLDAKKEILLTAVNEFDIKNNTDISQDLRKHIDAVYSHLNKYDEWMEDHRLVYDREYSPAQDILESRLFRKAQKSLNEAARSIRKLADNFYTQQEEETAQRLYTALVLYNAFTEPNDSAKFVKKLEKISRGKNCQTAVAGV